MWRMESVKPHVARACGHGQSGKATATPDVGAPKTRRLHSYDGARANTLPHILTTCFVICKAIAVTSGRPLERQPPASGGEASELRRTSALCVESTPLVVTSSLKSLYCRASRALSHVMSRVLLCLQTPPRAHESRESTVGHIEARGRQLSGQRPSALSSSGNKNKS